MMSAVAPDHDRTKIDWLTITHGNGPHLTTCLRGPAEKLPKGINTYHHAVRDGHGVIVARDGPEPRPFMLIMSGKPLDAWRAERSVRDLVIHLASQPVHCTRIDLARDTTGPWTPYRLQELIESNRYVSRWKKVRYISGKGHAGLTVELGSRKSDVMLRCYDKKAEMEAAGKPCPFDRLSRWELEFKGSLATMVFQQVADLAPVLDIETGEEEWPLVIPHATLLGSRLRLTVDPVDRDGKNQSDAVVLPEWAAFLADAANSVLAPGLDQRSPAQQAYETAAWARRSFAPTLAVLEAVGGRDLIDALIDRGRDRLSAKGRLIIERASETLPAVRRAILLA